MSNTETQQALADRQTIVDLIQRYCRSVDRIDPELGHSIWHEDGIAEYGEAIFNGSGKGVIDYICESHKRAIAHCHSVTNITIDLDGDKAGSESYVLMNMRMMQDGKLRHITFWGRYIDRWERRKGRWGLAKRKFVLDFDEIREGVTPYNKSFSGRRDREDASYGVLRSPV